MKKFLVTLLVTLLVLSQESVLSLPALAVSSNPPFGSLDSIDSNGSITGWAVDPDDTTKAVTVQLFFDALPSASGTPVNVTASTVRYDVGSHGFVAPVPSQYRDGLQHSVNAYALDLTDTSGGSNTLLPGSPTSFTLLTSSTAPSSAPVPVPAPSPAAPAPTPSPTPPPYSAGSGNSSVPNPAPVQVGGGVGSGGGGTYFPPIVITPSTASTSTTSGGSLAYQNPSSLSALPFSSGSLVNDKGVIFYIAKNTKIPFTSMKVFIGLGYFLKNITAADTSSYVVAQNFILSSSNQEHPWGSWLKRGRTVYYSTEQGYIPVPTWKIFISNGGSNKFLVRMNTREFKNLKKHLLPIMVETDARVIY